MGKIGKAIKALWWIARKPVLLNRVLVDEDTWQAHILKRYGLDAGLPVITLDQLTGPGMNRRPESSEEFSGEL